ncbi:MAG: LSM domain-containing protein [Candidatus Thorarchaeota archaeon]
MELLEKSLGLQVLVELKGRRKLKGRLRGFDQHVNLILDDAEEYVPAPDDGGERVEQIDSIIVRGDNVVLVSPPNTSTKE